MMIRTSFVVGAIFFITPAVYAQGDNPPPVIDQLGDLGAGVSGSIAGPECSSEVGQRLVEASTRAQKTRLSLLTLFNDKTLRDFNCLDAILDFEFTGELALPSLSDILQQGAQEVCNIANEFIQENLAKDIRVTVPGIELPGGILIGGGGFEASTSFSSSSSGSSPRGVNSPGSVSGPVDIPTFLPRIPPNGGGN